MSGTPVVHIGTSRFFRGHFLPLLQETNPDVKVTAISLMSTGARDDLRETDYNYDLVQQSTQDGSLEVTSIENLEKILVGAEDSREIFEILASKDTELVTLTITESAYKHDENVLFDASSRTLVSAETGEILPHTTGSIMVSAFYERFLKGEPLPVVMSLDNGEKLSSEMKRNLKYYADLHDTNFGTWLEHNLEVVDTMVDRIVPSGAQFDDDAFENAVKRKASEFRSPIYTEPLPLVALVMGSKSENRILNNLTNSPHVLVSQSDKYSRMKIRMVNGTHYALGILGRLGGYESTKEAMENPAIRVFVKAYINQMRISLKEHEAITRIDTKLYADEVFNRLANPYMDDQLTRLAKNSVSKLGPRLVSPMSDLIAGVKDHDLLEITMVGWAQYIARAALDPTFKIEDPLAESLKLLNRKSSYFENMETMFNSKGLAVFDAISGTDDIKDKLDRARARYEVFMAITKEAKKNELTEDVVADIERQIRTDVHLKDVPPATDPNSGKDAPGNGDQMVPAKQKGLDLTRHRTLRDIIS